MDQLMEYLPFLIPLVIIEWGAGDHRAGARGEASELPVRQQGVLDPRRLADPDHRPGRLLRFRQR